MALPSYGPIYSWPCIVIASYSHGRHGSIQAEGIATSHGGEAFLLRMGGGGGADSLERRMGDADVVVSLLPAALHADVMRAALALDKHVVTSSYVSRADI